MLKRARNSLCIVYLTAGLLCLATASTRADTVAWTGTTGLWSQSTNWSPHVPGATDAVIITNNGNVTLDGPASIDTLILGAVTNCGSGTLSLNSQTLTFGGQVQVNTCGQLFFNGGRLYGTGGGSLSGVYTWSGGPYPFGGNLVLGTNAVLNITGSADHDMPAATLINYGYVAWSGGRIRGGSTPGTFIYNYGVWDSQGDLTFNSDLGQEGLAFNNLGTLRKSAGTNTSTLFSPNGCQAYLINTGLLDVQTGAVVLNGGASFTGGSVTGAGLLYLNAGAFNLTNALTTTNVLLSGGVLTGNNALNGGFTWSSGNWTSAVSVTVAANTELDIVSGNDHDLANCTLTNLGTVEWLAGRIRGGGTPGTVIYNLGMWEARCDQVMNSDFGQCGVTFNNLGTFRKSAGTNSTAFSPNNSAAVFNNRGSVQTDSGSLVLNGGGLFSGHGAVAGPGVVCLNGGAFTINDSITFNVQETGGSLVGTNDLTGNFTWVSGSWNGANSVTVTGGVAGFSTLVISSDNDHDLANCTLTNLGDVKWLGGRIRGGGTPGTVIYNLGTWEARCDQALNSDYGQVGVRFVNSGAFRKLASGGSTSFNPNNSQASFASTGQVNIQTGSVVLNGGGSFTAGSVTGSGPLYLNNGGFSVNGTTTTLNVVLSGGVLVGANVLRGGFTWDSGNWNAAGPITLATGGELDITSSADHDMASCTFSNLGQVKWLGGRIRGGSTPGTVIYNLGSWDTQCDYAMNSDYNQFGLVFNNHGAFRKSVTPGVTSFIPNNSQAAFNNLGGGIELDSGTFSLPGNFAQNGGAMTIGLGGTAAGQWGMLSCAGSATLNGPLNVTFVNGFESAVYDQFQILSCANASRFGQFSPTTLPFGLTVDYQSSAVSLLATNGAARLLAPGLAGGQFQFGFLTAAGQSYTVLQNTNLATTNWSYYTNLTGNGGLVQILTPTANPPVRFFRVRTD